MKVIAEQAGILQDEPTKEMESGELKSEMDKEKQLPLGTIRV